MRGESLQRSKNVYVVTVKKDTVPNEELSDVYRIPSLHSLVQFLSKLYAAPCILQPVASVSLISRRWNVQLNTRVMRVTPGTNFQTECRLACYLLASSSSGGAMHENIRSWASGQMLQCLHESLACNSHESDSGRMDHQHAGCHDVLGNSLPQPCLSN